MNVQECMKLTAVSISAEAAVQDAVRLFVKHHIGTLPVVDWVWISVLPMIQAFAVGAQPNDRSSARSGKPARIPTKVLLGLVMGSTESSPWQGKAANDWHIGQQGVALGKRSRQRLA